jgi:hypothetical protein
MSDQSNADCGNGRDAQGRFAPGHPGGPGRPRRTVEHDYLATLSSAVPLDRWRRIVERAATDAEGGDSRAREWLSAYLLGRVPPGLNDLAVVEARGGVDAMINRVVDEANKQERRSAGFDRHFEGIYGESAGG